MRAKMTSVLVFMSAIAATSASGPVAAQSFNCNYAKLPDEVLICQNPYLGDLDEQMSALYFTVRNRLHGAARTQLKRDQTAWLKGRKTCGYDAACVENSYLQRIYQLNNYY